jgi:hypothetical protein
MPPANEPNPVVTEPSKLYQAKRRGRNQVQVFDPTVTVMIHLYN